MIIRMNQQGGIGEASQVVSFLRFPLIICVLLIHSGLADINANWSTLTVTPAVINFVSGTLAPVANPAFFFISGLLFFHEGTFDRQIYVRKLRRRARSLLVPYLLWNLLFLLCLFAVEAMKPGWTAIIDKPIASLSPYEWVCAFWDTSAIGGQGGFNAPVDMPLWFVRNLMVLVVLSPVVYWVVKGISRMHIYVQACLLLPLFYVVDRCAWWPELYATPAVFFTIGAYFSIRRIDLVNVFRNFEVVFLFTAICALYYGYANAGYLMLILLAFPFLGRQLRTKRIRVNEFLSSATFFIFAYHLMLQGVLLHAIRENLIPVNGEASALLCYVAMPTLLALVGLALYGLMDRFLPRLTSLLTGGR